MRLKGEEVGGWRGRRFEVEGGGGRRLEGEEVGGGAGWEEGEGGGGGGVGTMLAYSILFLHRQCYQHLYTLKPNEEKATPTHAQLQYH